MIKGPLREAGQYGYIKKETERKKKREKETGEEKKRKGEGRRRTAL